MTSLRAHWSPAAIAAVLFAAGVAALGLAGFVQLAAPPEREPGLVALPLAQTHLDRAERLMRAGPARLDAAEAEARAALRLSPSRTEGWLQLAYVARVRAGAWSPEAAEALAQSYRVGPLDPDVGTWRLRFAFEHWDALSPGLRKSALAELDALWSRGPMRKPLKALGGELANPAGRLAFAAETRALQKRAHKRG